MNLSLIESDTKIRVSSVLNKDNKQFGKKHLTDQDDDTCWNSDQGSPQFIRIGFPSVVSIEEVGIQFQGGFAGKECWIETYATRGQGESMSQKIPFFPEDINSVQRFIIEEKPQCTSVKIVFNTSTDLFGRITIYKLELSGTR